MKEKQKPTKKPSWEKRVCTVLKLKNIKPKYNVYIYVLCGAVSSSYYPNFSIFRVLLHWSLKEWTLSAKFKAYGIILWRNYFTD